MESSFAGLGNGLELIFFDQQSRLSCHEMQLVLYIEEHTAQNLLYFIGN